MGLFTERDEETTNEIIIGKLNRIEAKLDAVIKAMHEYDGDEWPEPNDALKEAAAQYNKLVAPCRGHDAASWNEEEMERRMNIIGQNGNEGLHYGDMENEFDDYGMRVVDRDNKDTQDKRVDKKKGKRKYYKPKNK
jgi:hypothetical protein